jgi:flagellar biogenesis protein FliO
LRAEILRRVILAAVLAAGLIAAPGLAPAKDEPVPAKEPIPFKRDADAFETGTLLRTALALGAVIAVGFAGIYALKRFLPASLGRSTGGPGRINVLEIRRVTPRLTLFLVEIDGQKVFLAQSGDRVRPLRLPGSATTSGTS